MRNKRGPLHEAQRKTMREMRRRLDAADEILQPPVSIAPCMIVRRLEQEKRMGKRIGRSRVIRWAAVYGMAAALLVLCIMGGVLTRRPQVADPPIDMSVTAETKLFQPDLSTGQRNSYYDIYLAFEEIRRRQVEKGDATKAAAPTENSGLQAYTPERKKAEPDMDGMQTDMAGTSPASSAPETSSKAETPESDTASLLPSAPLPGTPSDGAEVSPESPGIQGQEPIGAPVEQPADISVGHSAASSDAALHRQPASAESRAAGSEEGDPDEKAAPAETIQISEGFQAQVPSVDEADIVKTDGDYLYILSRYARQGWQLSIINIGGGNMRLSSKTYVDFQDGQDLELYVWEDKLVILGNLMQSLGGMAADGVTQAQIYDISDRQNPVCTRTFRQQGLMAGSRLVDHTLYVVTAPAYPYISHLDEELVQNYLPRIWDSEIGRIVPLHPSQVQIVRDTDCGSYCFVSAVDLTGGVKMAAALGGGDVLYCSTDTMYIAAVRQAEGHTFSEVLRFSLDDSLRYTGRGRLPGAVQDSLSMDVKNGYLRVISRDPTKQTTGLYILDEGLAIVGYTEGIGSGQEMESIRFDGDTVYLSFAGQDNAVLIIDVSNPVSPSVLNCFSLYGFKGMLYPLGEGRLLTVENDEGQITLQLFDASDPSKMRRMDSKTLQVEGQALYTEAAFSYHALAYLTDREWAFLPIAADSGFSGFLALRLDDGGIRIQELMTTAHRSSDGRYYFGNGDWARRIVAVQDTGFAIADGAVLSFSMDSLRQGALLRLYDYTTRLSDFSDVDRTLMVESKDS